MNERIQLLAEQADLYARSDNSSMLFENYKKRYTEKFAELIVAECAEYAEHNLDMAGYKKKFMLKHFGVEL